MKLAAKAYLRIRDDVGIMRNVFERMKRVTHAAIVPFAMKS